MRAGKQRKGKESHCSYEGYEGYNDGRTKETELVELWHIHEDFVLRGSGVAKR